MKPPILSDEEIQRWQYDIYRGRKVAQAQYDALVAYYEPLIEQAKAEIAEKIFQDIEEELAAFEDFSVKTQHQAAIVKTNWWEHLKSKYGGKKNEREDSTRNLPHE